MSESLHHILVPLDGSRLAEAVLPAAFGIAAACGATVTLLHVLEHNAPETVHGEPHIDDPAEATRYLESVAARERGTGVPIEIHIHENPEHDVARSIAEHAEELDVGLIAIATHGSGGLRGFLAGSIAQQTLRRSSIPVLLVRPLVGEPPPFHCRTILVPLDATRESEMALPFATMLARDAGARLQLVRVVPTVTTVEPSGAPSATFSPTATAALLAMERNEARESLSAVQRRIDSGITVGGEVRRGDTVDELLKAVEQQRADIVVMSTHGRSGLEGFWSASVAARLIGRLTTPVVLVPIPRGDQTSPVDDA